MSAFLGLLLLICGSGDYRPTSLELAVAPYRHNVMTWEVSHLPDKWTHLSNYLVPWFGRQNPEQRRSQAREYFDLGRELQRLESQLPADSAADPGARRPAGRVQRIRDQRRAMRAEVEQTVESEISAILADEGLQIWPGLVFPPVDVHFSSPPGVLVLSPRDRIFRQQTVVLKPGMISEEKEALEQQVFESEDLSALVVEIGGIATYPSNIPDSVDLPRALEVVAHEWLHHWFFFRPLGRAFWDSPEMTTLNETAATLGGAELGAMAYAAMVKATMAQGTPAAKPGPNRPPAGFDAAQAIRETRLRTEELLARGEILEAEAHMEERRQLLVDRGYRIRKINQAFFAFRESYATDPGSISPIDDQLRGLRQSSDSLGQFLRTVAGFGSYEEFLEYLESGG